MQTRLLLPTDRAAILRHYLALSPADRRTRFFVGVSDAFIRDYCRRLSWVTATVLGRHDGDRLLGVAELIRPPGDWSGPAELAVSVAAMSRRQGVGTALVAKALAIARNHFIPSVTMLCLPENAAMRRLAARFKADLSFQGGEVVGRIVSPWPNLASLVDEAAAEGQTFLQAAFDVALPRPQPRSESQAGLVR